MSPFNFNDNGEIDGEDFFLINGPLMGKRRDTNDNDNNNDNDNDNNPFGCGTIVVLIIVMFLLSKCLF